MTIHRVDITRNDTGTVMLSPSPLQVTDGDSVFWRNMDGAQHWITKKDAAKNFWFQSPLAPFAQGQPADSTSEIAIDAPRIDYSCIDASGRIEADGTVTVPAVA